MNGLKKALEQELSYLNHILKELDEKSVSKKEQRLRVSMRGNSDRYYYRENGKVIYIPKENHSKAKELAQQEYEYEALKLAERRRRQIARLLRDYQDDEIEGIYEHSHPARQKLITPIDPTWQQQVAAWRGLSYQGKEFWEGNIEIVTECGERVRSKSEKILADTFFYAGIHYHYEEPLYLKRFGLVYPDFTFMSEKLHKKIIWEHLGRMDDSEYSAAAAKKLNLYMKNGYYPGDKLIITFETSNSGLQMDIVKNLIRKYLRDK